jgi:hypothetical protein
VPSSTAIDVAIGLAFVYFFLSLIVSAINETIATAAGWRAKYLKKGLVNMLMHDDPAKTVTQRVADAEEELGKLFASPLIAPMVKPRARWRKPEEPRHRYPSYIPSHTFVAAVLDGARAAAEHADDLEKVIAKVPEGRVRDAFQTLYQRAGGNAHRFETLAAQWYDDTMERVSGWYKRRAQLVIWIVGLVLAALLNADSIHIARTLWNDQAVRDAVVQQAQVAVKPSGDEDRLKTVADSVGALDKLKVPMGWSAPNRPGGWGWLSTVMGVLLTGAALSLGAPFWFDLLSKIARLRASGAPPPATQAVRHGEGEETRAGPGATVS